VSSRRKMGPSGAVAEIMAADREREERPLGGYASELAQPERSAPAPPAPAPLVIPPPPWAEGGDPPKEGAA
jgi:hypothetical protein